MADSSSDIIRPAGRVTKSERQAAVLMDRDCGRVEDLTLRAVLRLVRSGQRQLIDSFRRGQDVGVAAKRIIESFRRDLVSSMLLSSVTALDRARRSGTIAMAEGPSQVGPVFQKALDFLLARNRLTDSQLAEMESRADANVVRVLAAATKDAQTKLGQAVAELYAKNLTIDDGVDLLTQAWQSAGLGAANPYQVEGIVRTQIGLAYGAGVRAGAKRPEIDEILWGWKYVTVGDDRVRPTHAAMDGTTLPKDDPFWRENSCPNGFLCRCKQIMLFSERDETRPPETIDVNGKDIEVVADDGFRFDPGELIPHLAT